MDLIRDEAARAPIKVHRLRHNVKPTAAFDAKWGQFVITPAFFTRLVYEGV